MSYKYVESRVWTPWLEHSVEEISKQRTESVALLLFVAYCKMQEDNLKEKLLNRKEPKIDDLGNSQLIQMWKMLN